MSIANRLYDRPWLDQHLGAPALYVAGVLPQGQVKVAYEGRLQIHGAQGACWAELINGELPPGAAVYADNDTAEVVVAWPAFQNLAGLINPSLESGDMTGWDQQAKGGSGTLTVAGAHHTDGGLAAYWAGGRGAGSEGGIECVATNQATAPIYPGQRVTGSVDIGYNFAGGTPKGSRGQARLRWYAANDVWVGESQGDLIYTRAHNNSWATSHVTGVAPARAAYVRLAVWVTATGAGHTWFDRAQWDALNLIGIADAFASNITIRVHDAAGRVADWTGLVQVGYLILTSGLYPQFAAESAHFMLRPGPLTIHTQLVQYTQPAEKSAWSLSVGELAVHSAVRRYTQPAEKSAWSLSVGELAVHSAVRRYTQPAEKSAWSLLVGDMTITEVIRYTNRAEKSVWSMAPGELIITTL